MFERITDGMPETVTIVVDGAPVSARASDTVAVALLAAGARPFSVNACDGAPRAPYCLMGVCYECRVDIDGETSVQACTTPVRDGMRIALGGGSTDG